MKRVFAILFCILNSVVGLAQQYEVTKSIENDSVYFDLISLRETPLWWQISTIDSLNVTSNFISYGKLHSKDTVFSLVKIPQQETIDTINLQISDFLDFKLRGADPKAQHEVSYPYKIPYSSTSKFEVIQTFKQSFSHDKPTSFYAVDFALPIRTPITASRDGVVIQTEDSFKEAGGRELFDSANYIYILHEDGTFAQYLHLDYKGVIVKQNDIVKAGQHIGYSGHTGFSTRPHLHFVVKNGLGISQEFRFSGYRKWLKTGKRYKGQGDPNLD
ncbi:M23 family metallopeptidase [Dokdonia sinensis]|uniref:M23 family metallopeptidase n=1 Tax=Dokdonia sinensis TaxID=2479847 RepID=A0A3M0G698_9FLAO|nr:M23 family metallopeptidase [Dokdonia sinensis]RMB60580.1 M23 family metallopeptidase [Dokdonia sinensis]